MTELMKRYEAEMGKNVYRPSYTQWLEIKVEAEKRCYQQLSEMYIVVSRAEAYQRKEAEKLKAQLTWRPVSVKPEREGIYLIKRVDLDTELMLYRNGEWWVSADELFQYLEFDFDIMSKKFQPTHWLPIPPAPEGE